MTRCWARISRWPTAVTALGRAASADSAWTGPCQRGGILAADFVVDRDGCIRWSDREGSAGWPGCVVRISPAAPVRANSAFHRGPGSVEGARVPPATLAVTLAK